VQTASTAPALLFGLIAGRAFRHRRPAARDSGDTDRPGCIDRASGRARALRPDRPRVASRLYVLIGRRGSRSTCQLQQASTNDLVARDELARAVALGAVAFNGRARGRPGARSAIAAGIGSGSAMVASAACLRRDDRCSARLEKPEASDPGRSGDDLLGNPERAPLYAALADDACVIFHNLAFSVCASALWALAAREALAPARPRCRRLRMLSAFFGMGAIAGRTAAYARAPSDFAQPMVGPGVVLWVGCGPAHRLDQLYALALVGAAAAAPRG